ncbi:MAG: hypothetical protein ACJ77D_05485 [Chloroflexota bacterium]
MREDVRAARAVGRQMIAGVLVIPLLVVFWWLAQPGDIGPMLYEPPWYAAPLPWLAAAVYVTGLAWMIRIYRTSHLEPETSSWRYRKP